MEESSKLVQQKLDAYAQKQDATNRKFDDAIGKLLQSFDEIKTQLRGMSSSHRHDARFNSDASGSQEPNDSGTRSLKYTPKLDFSKFDGNNPRIWIKKCVRYFELCKIPNDQKVDIASLHMLHKAETWVSSYLANRRSVDWDDFIIDLIARFRDDGPGKIVEQFNRLQQTGPLEDYIDEFENARSLMLQNNHIFPDSYMLDSFIGGLKASVKPFFRAFKPTTIAQEVEYARLKEETTTNGFKPSKFSTTTQPTPLQSVPLLANSLPPLLPTPAAKNNQLVPYKAANPRNSRFIPADVRAEKIAKGLCYYCDQTYEKGHKCKFKEPQLFTVEVPSDDADLLEDCMSHTFQTMRLKGVTKGKPLHILVDSGSTHNFVDLVFAQKLGCHLEEVEAQAVIVADGSHIVCKHKCQNFHWLMNGREFVTEVLLIPLGSCDMVLGIQWLSTLGAVQWDFKKLQMDFILNNELITLKGIPPRKLKVIEGQPSPKMMQNAAHCCLLQLNKIDSVLSMENKGQQPDFPELQQLRQEFASVFEDPVGLPPSRTTFDHKIPLAPGEGPVNIRPYRYPLKQRDIIEQLVQEMLDRGIIQNSSSPFASPVVLVGKKDGTWRLCIDYRELNRKTVKDKFPIPVIDELIDELARAKIFSKLDLRAGYHQLRLHPDDVFKTAFKTHTGHYEFLVMPFGLNNAPASFQNWMNSVFKSLLRKCVVEYLGHFISGKGVETDPQKLIAITSWQVASSVKELRGFLGLAGYYRKFVRSFAVISKPLTDLLKKGGFEWSAEAQSAFDTLKKALTSAPVLAVPDFNEPFVVETDASKKGI
ncbi:uncharacterized protein LOC135152240 [Daucus carota subsp. sativus]|uniref:uncharacterized protein LOC135152240 n=1 Tax=Daucus carota subsp. sativus TaxID=79200 RepID=UPI00308330C3